MKLIIGLGNPGKEYENTRHNAGFMAVDAFAKKHDITFSLEPKMKGMLAQVNLGGNKAILLKPMTYMNLSGEAVSLVMNFYKIPPENVIVIFDDISLDVGKMRIRRKGSDGGHNGIKNIIYLSGSDKFPRVKVGVGHKPKKWDLADWVLSSFTSAEMKTLAETAGKVCTAVELMISGNTDKAMNQFNS